MKRKPGIGLPIKDHNDLSNSIKNPSNDFDNQDEEYISPQRSSYEKMQEMKWRHEQEFLRQSQNQFQNQPQNINPIQPDPNFNNTKNELVFQPTPQNSNPLFAPKQVYTNQTYTPPSPNAPSYAEVKQKHHRSRLSAVLVTTLLLGLCAASLWYTGYLGKIKETVSFAKSENKTSSNSLSSVSFQKNEAIGYDDCVKNGGAVESIQKVDGCTLNGKLFVKEIGVENWTELVKIKKNSLQNNIIPQTPINLTELTTFRVGKDLNKDLLVGNTVYSANINNNSEAYGLAYFTSPKFGLKPEGREEIFTKFDAFLKGGAFDTSFNKLIATDPETMARNQTFLMDFLDLNKNLLNTHFSPTQTRTILVKETIGETQQLTLQVWMNVSDTVILLEENFSNAQNKKVVDAVVAACQNLDDVNCVSNTINASEEFKKYILDLSTGLINKFQIK